MMEEAADPESEGGELLPPIDIPDPEFETAFGESLTQTLNLDTWVLGEDLAELYGRLEEEVARAVEQEDRITNAIRQEVFHRIATAPHAPKGAGVYQAQSVDLQRIHRGLLFNGGVEACDGTNVVHDTIPLTITQIGVCLVSYNGQQGTWAHRLFRRDLRETANDPVGEALALLERREKREGQGIDTDTGKLSQLARRGIMTYAERAILLQKSRARWRMGHGNPAPYELLTGLWASNPQRIQVSLDIITNLVAGHQRFIFVPSAPARRDLLTIGNALNPLEFAILSTLEYDIYKLIDNGGYRGEVRTKMMEFCRDIGSQIVLGLYRASSAAPPYIFYAHVDHAFEAAHIALADSVLQEHRGFPMLIDLADTVCTTTFGVDSFVSSVQLAYTETGQPFRFLGERETRSR
jgi:hypothetical protein